MTPRALTAYLSAIAFCMAGIVGIFAVDSRQTPQEELRAVQAPETASNTLVPPVVQQEATTTTAEPRRISRVSPTTSEVPPRLTAAQEATIEAGLRGELGQNCPDVCEALDTTPEAVDMSEAAPTTTTSLDIPAAPVPAQ